MVTLIVFMQLWLMFQIIMNKILYLILDPILGVLLILECDLYSNKYGICVESHLLPE